MEGEVDDMTEKWITGLGKTYHRLNNTVFIDVPKKEVMKAVDKAREKGAILNDIAGYDNGREYEISYTLTSGGNIFTIRTRISRVKPEIESATMIFPGAELMERECFESLGISFPGNPFLKKILHAESTPKTPLRKKGGGK
jgi:NADH-quinone oxidoreductase subunit C